MTTAALPIQYNRNPYRLYQTWNPTTGQFDDLDPALLTTTELPPGSKVWSWDRLLGKGAWLTVAADGTLAPKSAPPAATEIRTYEIAVEYGDEPSCNYARTVEGIPGEYRYLAPILGAPEFEKITWIVDVTQVSIRLVDNASERESHIQDFVRDFEAPAPVASLLFEAPADGLTLPISVGRLTARGRALEDGQLLVKSWGTLTGTYAHHARRDGTGYVVETVMNGAVTKSQPASTLVGALDLMHLIAPAYQWKIVENKKAITTKAAIA